MDPVIVSDKYKWCLLHPLFIEPTKISKLLQLRNNCVVKEDLKPQILRLLSVGGEENIKFSRQKLHELLLEINTLPVKDQKVHLENRMDEWIFGHEQIDDMMIVGIRF